MFDIGKHVISPLISFINYILIDHLLYWFNNLGIVGDELTEEVDLPQEIFHGFLFQWVGNLCDGPNPIQVYLYPTFINDVSQEVTFGHYKDTLLGIQGYPVFTKLIENIIQMV